jgi:integrase/recombinase XerD
MRIGIWDIRMHKSVMNEMLISKAIEDFLKAKEVEGCSPNTLVDYGRTMRRLLAFISTDVSLDQITAAQIREFLSMIPGGGKNKRNTYIGLSSLWSFCLQQKYCKIHLIREMVDPPKFTRKVIDPFDHAEVERILKSLDGPTWQRDRAMIVLLLDTGLRASELCQLKIMDFLTKDCQVVLGKGDKERRIPFSDDCKLVVIDYLHSNWKYACPALIQTDDGKVYNRHALAERLHDIGEAIGIPNVHAHRFRHTFAVQYLLNGGDPFSLMKILGHSDMDMVNRYVEFTNYDIIRQHAKASPAKNWNLSGKR